MVAMHSSNISIKDNKIEIIILVFIIKNRSTCPVIILQANRKDRVRGRINSLTSSNNTKNGHKILGDLKGRSREKK